MRSGCVLLLLYQVSVLSFQYNNVKMSADSLVGKSLGPRISTYSLMGECLGHCAYAPLFLLNIYQVQQL